MDLPDGHLANAGVINRGHGGSYDNSVLPALRWSHINRIKPWRWTHPYRILQCLAENDDQAFTETEIHDATGIKRGSVGATLLRLEERGLVRPHGWYWAISEDDRLASYAVQAHASSASTTEDYFDEE